MAMSRVDQETAKSKPVPIGEADAQQNRSGSQAEAEFFAEREKNDDVARAILLLESRPA